MTESADCPEGLESSDYYYFYAIRYENDNIQPSESESEVEAENWSVELISEYTVCETVSEPLGYIIDINECATKVLDVGAAFFNFDPSDGECVARYTRDASCPEGLEDHRYF